MIFILIFIVGVAAGLLFVSAHRVLPLLRSSSDVSISFPPNDLRMNEVIVAILLMVSKSFRGLFSKLYVYWHGKSSPSGLVDSQPCLRSPFAFSQKHVALYRNAIGLNDQTDPSLPIPHRFLFLSAITEPAVLLLLASSSSPINPLGAVNVRNRFEILKPDLCSLDVLTEIKGASLFATMRNGGRPAKRGTEYDLEVGILVLEDGKQEVVFRQIFTMMVIEKKRRVVGEDNRELEKDLQLQNTKPSRSAVQMHMSHNDPSRWAALCRDYNFIHTSALAAKLYGFPGKLAHGNHVAAKALQRLWENGDLPSFFDVPSWMEVRFKRPVVVPSVLDIEVMQPNEGKNGSRINIFKRSKVFVELEYGSL